MVSRGAPTVSILASRRRKAVPEPSGYKLARRGHLRFHMLLPHNAILEF